MIKVNQDKCVGCGMCAGLCADIFSMNLEGKAEVINQGDIECARNAAENCPTEAISVN